MKKIFAIAAVAALATSPALARPAHHHMAANAAANSMASEVATEEGVTINQLAAQQGITPAAAADLNAVYVDGHYVGADPDPAVRQALRSDYYHLSNGG